MNTPNNRHPFKRHRAGRRRGRPKPDRRDNSGTTGSEAAYLKSLVDSRAMMTVVLTTGERLRGRIRYYDRECFSLGPAAGGPKIFLRKSSVCYMQEE